MELCVNPKASKWILKQPWLSQFVDNCIAAKNSPAMILSYFLGMESANTVNDGFLWSNTPEGSEFWNRVDDEMEEVSNEEDWDDSDIIIEI